MTVSVDEIRYDTAITRVGAMVPDFLEKKILIFFSEGAPSELHDMCVLHEPDIKVGGLAVGDIVVLDGHEFPILAVGSVADNNLVNLGHIDLKFNGLTTAPLPGDVCLPDIQPPLLAAGSRFSIVSAAAAATTDSEEN